MATIVLSVEGVLTDSGPNTDIMNCDASKSGRILYTMIKNSSRVLLISNENNVAKVKGWLARERFTKYADVHCYPAVSPLTHAQWKVQHVKDLMGVGHHIEFFIDSEPDTIKMAIEAGVTGMLPFEVRAGNDIERIRRNHPHLQILGGIDKMALRSRERIDEELKKVRRMMRKSGYIPFVDHAYPPDISFEHYSYFRKKLTEIVRPGFRS